MSRLPADTATARAWLVSHPKQFNALSEAAQRTVAREGLRGRLHPEAIERFNKGQRKFEYVPGNTLTAAKAAASAAAKARKAAQAKAKRKGAVVGARGPLPKQFVVVPKG